MMEEGRTEEMVEDIKERKGRRGEEKSIVYNNRIIVMYSIIIVMYNIIIV